MPNIFKKQSNKQRRDRTVYPYRRLSESRVGLPSGKLQGD
jgi:hypothetical protein